MKYSLITLSLLASISFAEFINPLPADSRAKDNGGLKNSIEAYTDGIGVQVIDNKYATELNQQHSLKDLIFKYGEKAKTNGNSVVDYVSLAPESTTEEKTIAQEIKSLSWTGPIDGTSCDDNNPLTTGETYLNGVCQGGTILDGTSCDDGNYLTYNDVYTNGNCSGIAVPVAKGTCDTGFNGDYLYAIYCSENTIKTEYLNAGWLNLTSTGQVFLRNTTSLKSLHGLENIRTINSYFWLNNMPSLTDISALSNVTNISSGRVILDYKNFTKKMSADSYICKNAFNGKLQVGNNGGIYAMTQEAKDLVCEK